MTRSGNSRHVPGLVAGALIAAASAWVSPSALAAQEVVQALPTRETAQLNAALRTLATRPSDLNALLNAANASLALRDPAAAAGFFARAGRVAPQDARVILGLARVALEQQRPVEALQGFANAESAGARPIEIAADRALAYDLVGDNMAAQTLYRSVLAAGENEEVRRRLALSLAIAGNRSEFERTLYPLLRKEDRAAFRTRAFGLAILGAPDDAVEIADAMMPTDLALRMAPYLRYMPRLTRAQQAAAGNLGTFPAAADIGRDPPSIASYAGAGARISSNANTSLTPAGAPLGSRATPPIADSAGVARRRSGREIASGVSGAATTTVAAASTASARVAAAQPRAVNNPAGPIAAAPAAALSSTSGAALTQAPTVVARSAVAASPVIRDALPTTSAPAPATSPARQSLSDAFADLGAEPAVVTRPATGAVDVTKLTAARTAAAAKAKAEADTKAKAKKEADAKLAKAKSDKLKAEKAAQDAEPARVWVQIGVGRNTSAFAFDWKKLAKQAGGALDGKGPWAVKYGATNRMLAGPFPTDVAARSAIKRLKEKNIEALPYDSAKGEKVAKVG